MHDLTRQVLAISEGGLNRRARLDGSGASEAQYLAPLREIVQSGQTQAERLLALHKGSWNGKVEPVFDSNVY